MTLVVDELAQFNLDVTTCDEFFEEMSSIALKAGYVTETFEAAIKEREFNYPTALPVQPYAIAIPHCDPNHIVEQFIAPVKLKNSVKWGEMANNDSQLDVRVAFMLGFKKEEGHIEVLQHLINYFQDEELMNNLLNSNNKEEFLKLVSSMKGI